MTPLSWKPGRAIWSEFAKLVGVAPRHAEAALHSERVAQGVLSRRAMFSATAALAAGTVFGFPSPEPTVLYFDTDSLLFAFPGSNTLLARSIMLQMMGIMGYYDKSCTERMAIVGAPDAP